MGWLCWVLTCIWYWVPPLSISNHKETNQYQKIQFFPFYMSQQNKLFMQTKLRATNYSYYKIFILATFWVKKSSRFIGSWMLLSSFLWHIYNVTVWQQAGPAPAYPMSIPLTKNCHVWHGYLISGHSCNIWLHYISSNNYINRFLMNFTFMSLVQAACCSFNKYISLVSQPNQWKIWMKK